MHVSMRWPIVLTLLAAALWSANILLRPDLFDGDAAHHIFWLYRYVDQNLFPNDITVDYLRTSAPLGYRALYSMLAPVFDPVIASKWVSVVLFACSAWLAWLMGRAVPGPDADLRGFLTLAALLVMMSLYPQTDMLATMGMQRAFGLPITLLTLLGLVSGRYLLVGLSWILAALFYPVLLPVLGLSAGVVFLRDLLRNRQMPPRWILNGVAAALAVALALWGVPQIGALGPAIPYAEAMTMPEFGSGGRLDLWGPAQPGVAIWHGMTGLGWRIEIMVGLAIAAAIAIWQREGRLIPLGAWAMAVTGLGLWLLLRLYPTVFMFGLYLPNRHPRWAIAAFGALVLSAGAFAAYQWMRLRVRPDAQPLLRVATLAVASMAALACLVPEAMRHWRQPVDADLARTYAFLETQPKNVLIAAHPDLADYIPLFSKRSVLASTETSMPWMRGYYDLMKPRLEASLRAAYATSIVEMNAALAPYDVSLMVTGPQSWSSASYVQPHDALVQALRKQGETRGFVLQSPPADRVVFRSGEYTVVQVGALP